MFSRGTGKSRDTHGILVVQKHYIGAQLEALDLPDIPMKCFFPVDEYVGVPMSQCSHVALIKLHLEEH